MRGKQAVEEGFTLMEQMARNYYFMLDRLDEVDEEYDPEEFQNPYESYQGFPVEFCRDILGVTFTEDIEDMLNTAQKTPVTLAKSANGVGKSFAAACFVLYWFICYPGAQVYTIAAPPEDNLKLILWGEISSLVEKHPGLFLDYRVSLDSLKITRKNNRKSFIVGLAIPQAADENVLKSRFSGKHAPFLLFVVDEGDGVKAAIYEAIDTCMSGGMARMLITFNPRANTGPVAAMERKGDGAVLQLSAFDHPNVVTGKDLIPGAVNRNETVRRIHLMTEPVIAGERVNESEYFKVPDFLVGAIAYDRANRPFKPLPAGWRRIVEPSFSYMVLARYPAQAENQLISEAWVDAAVTRWLLWRSQFGPYGPPGIRPVMGYDVAELGNDSNVITLVYGSFVAPQIVWRGVDIEVSGEKAIRVYQQNNCQWVNVDATGVGAGAWAKMKHAGCNAYRIMVQSNRDLKEGAKAEHKTIPTDADFEGFDSIRSQMLWDFREFLRTDDGAMLPDDPTLREELLAPSYTKNRRGEITVSTSDILKEKIDRSPDRLMSIALRWAKQPSGTPEVRRGTYGAAKMANPTRKRIGKAGLSMV